jgi:hypothetical protein
MPFTKGNPNPTTTYYNLKKQKKNLLSLDKSVPYPIDFKLWLVERAEEEGIRSAFEKREYGPTSIDVVAN